LSQKGSPASNHLAFTSGNELASSLTSKQYGRPLALGAVIQDAVDSGALIPLQNFMASKKSIYTKSWVPTPWQVMSWGLRQLGVSSTNSDDKLAVGNFVVLANVEAAAEAVMMQVSKTSDSLTSRIYSRSLFESTFANSLPDTTCPLSQNDMSILLTYLSRDKPVLSYSSNTIKFADPGTVPEEITTQDTTIANLRTLITTMQSQVDTLTSKIADLDRASRLCIAEKRLPQAKAHLRSKKLATATLESRTATLGQLEETFTAIETAADQVAVVEAMKASSGVLGDLHRQVGGVEGVEDVVEKLRAEMENVDEVGRVITEGNPAGVVDEGDVEEEFEALERGEREKREEAEAEKTAARLEELEGKVPEGVTTAESSKEIAMKDETESQDAGKDAAAAIPE